MKRIDAFTDAYIECALWASTAYGSPEEREDIKRNGEGHFDRSFQSCGYDKLGAKLRKQIEKDCKAFQADNAELLAKWYTECNETEERAGHDFWLTRNRHGAGFWDRWSSGTPQGQIGKLLTDAAHAYGSFDLAYHRGRVIGA